MREFERNYFYWWAIASSFFSLSFILSSLSSQTMYSSTKGNSPVQYPIQWIAGMDVDVQPKANRKTSIICTIGPGTNKVEKLVELIDAGMNIVRMNFSHGDYSYHKSVLDNARAAGAQRPDNVIAIALDTKGPEIRTGAMRDGKELPISRGHEMVFSTDDQYANVCDDKVMYVDYKNLPKVIDVGKLIYVDDGVLSFKVLEKGEDYVKVQAQNNGKLASKKGVNLPKTPVDLPALSEKDKNDLRFGVENGVDMIFASFIRRAQDVKDIRRVLGEKGKNVKIICKIENHQGCKNFDEILAETDGIMIARGDMGIEIPCERVFIAQKMMIAKCNLMGKPVACATQMLESMTYNPRPTRAEVSDVANAVLDGADLVMLSGETAKGAYPVEAVQTMAATCILAESVLCYPPLFNQLRSLTTWPTETTETVACAAVSAAAEQNAGAIIVLSKSGHTARLASKYRPAQPIIVVTRDEQTARQSHLSRGVFPFIYRENVDENWEVDVENRIKWGIMQGKKFGLVKSNDSVVVVQGWKGGLGNTNTVRVLIAP
ncbi:pyruvate kinase [Radiomyces spectabilis]|uniref:pyruvate kinase n=1 Tax=Radiomyces spectabilis TaxID=64574 RepID=UPI0022206FFA|nr:pyruvate kinase [Radiomyces spectabilis]KAI8381375.1 pyruvate kinase [Radiomyces spectabilis]